MQKGKEKCKGKHNNAEAMPIVVVGNATQLWEQIPSPPKTRPPYMTWTLVELQRQVQDDAWKMNRIKDLENEHGISALFI